MLSCLFSKIFFFFFRKRKSNSNYSVIDFYYDSDVEPLFWLVNAVVQWEAALLVGRSVTVVIGAARVNEPEETNNYKMVRSVIFDLSIFLAVRGVSLTKRSGLCVHYEFYDGFFNITVGWIPNTSLFRLLVHYAGCEVMDSAAFVVH